MRSGIRTLFPPTKQKSGRPGAEARAALEGLSLPDYVLAELRRFAEHPTRAELLARVRDRDPVATSVSVAELIREERDSR